MYGVVILTKDNIESVAKQTGRSEVSLVKLLINFSAGQGRRTVRVPVYDYGRNFVRASWL